MIIKIKKRPDFAVVNTSQDDLCSNNFSPFDCLMCVSRKQMDEVIDKNIARLGIITEPSLSHSAKFISFNVTSFMKPKGHMCHTSSAACPVTRAIFNQSTFKMVRLFRSRIKLVGGFWTEGDDRMQFCHRSAVITKGYKCLLRAQARRFLELGLTTNRVLMLFQGSSCFLCILQHLCFRITLLCLLIRFSDLNTII